MNKHQVSIYEVQIPKGKAVNPVGSEDSVFPGFAADTVQNLEPENLIRYGITMGVLNAMEEKTGYINPDNIERCMAEIRLERIGSLYRFSLFLFPVLGGGHPGHPFEYLGKVRLG